MSEARQLIERFWALFEAGRIAECAELFDADCDFKMPGMQFRGREALVQMLEAYRVAFPDLKHQALHHVATGDTLAIELHVTGTHTGPMQMPQGTVPATGNKVLFESCDYIRLNRGRIVSWHVYHDSVPFLTALGLMPAPSA